MRAIYDCHVNVWDPEHYLPLYQEQLARVRPGGLPPKSDADTLARELAGAEKAILFSPRYGDSLGIQGSDETTAEAVARYPDLFVGFAYLDPREPNYMDKLRRSISEHGFKGVKYGPIYNGVGLGDERMQPVYAFLQENDLPLTLHMGTTFTVNSPIDCGRPLHVDPVALAYPELKIVMAHMGHPWTAECTVIVRKNRNVYGELTGLCYRPWIFYNCLAEIQDYSIVDKVFFGTDFPFSGLAEAVDGLRGVNDIVAGSALPRITEETIETILHSNPFEHWWHDRPF
jgi:predicted TIM-barrel fold metal-dependent hydrolase